LPALFKKLLLCLAPASVAFAANTQISTNKPIVNFRLPVFNAESYRAWMVRGSEGRYEAGNRVGITELTLSIFSGKADEKVETLILSPNALVRLDDSIVTGPSTIRVISDQFEASGEDWTYGHTDKKISIKKRVRIVLNTEIKDILK
jgi:hypothetical protein